MKLLTLAHQNAKTAKNNRFENYFSAILHLAPHNVSGYNVCPAASNGCAMACLKSAGRGKFNNVQQARIRKTKLFFQNRQEFFNLLLKDISLLEKKAKKLNKLPVVRLNGTSDIDWETIIINDNKNIFDLYPNVIFYDYSKRVNRFYKQLPKNYHLTFSMSEVNHKLAEKVLKLGFNVAVVFKDTIPTLWNNTKVVNGDEHDLRFLEGYQGVYIGLKAKGKAKKDTTGFVKAVA